MLYRDNDSALPLIDLLERAGTPYRCRQVESAFFTSRVVRDVTDVIRFALDPWDGERFLRLYYKLGAGISRSLAQEAADRADGRGRPSWPISAVSPGRLPGQKAVRRPEHPPVNLLQERGDRAVYRIVHFMGYGAYLEEHGMDGSRADILEPSERTSPRPWPCWSGWRSWSRWCGGCTRWGGGPVPAVHHPLQQWAGVWRVILMDVADGIFPKSVPEARSCTGGAARL